MPRTLPLHVQTRSLSSGVDLKLADPVSIELPASHSHKAETLNVLEEFTGWRDQCGEQTLLLGCRDLVAAGGTLKGPAKLSVNCNGSPWWAQTHWFYRCQEMRHVISDKHGWAWSTGCKGKLRRCLYLRWRVVTG